MFHCPCYAGVKDSWSSNGAMLSVVNLAELIAYESVPFVLFPLESCFLSLCVLEVLKKI